ncbi:hypothetical protein AJ80_09623 [Polytolypa hystricis UAMH7299]|uniref:RBR-type E3 ubiquitin transferase n=1 Tax=Polytolypa hystricis (strain UAMH7299) TaxID=1447883 RepID=A0A2B7WMX4_POLH7|nr:hypothetical protein AJ80_09623 [Polytolypa hystricis UAMH7299]
MDNTRFEDLERARVERSRAIARRAGQETQQTQALRAYFELPDRIEVQREQRRETFRRQLQHLTSPEHLDAVTDMVNSIFLGERPAGQAERNNAGDGSNMGQEENSDNITAEDKAKALLEEIKAHREIMEAQLGATAALAGNVHERLENLLEGRRTPSPSAMALRANRRSHATAKSGKYTECDVCTERKRGLDIIELSCSHIICSACVVEFFEQTLADESRFPPKCCGDEIPFSLAKGFLHVGMERHLGEKMVEYNDMDRTYCANPTCAQYIKPENRDCSMGGCEACGDLTCISCKKTLHVGPCDNEYDLIAQGMMLLNDWQQCAKCRNMIERVYGCNHIKCRCGYEFCYSCGVNWENDCECDDEDCDDEDCDEEGSDGEEFEDEGYASGAENWLQIAH